MASKRKTAARGAPMYRAIFIVLFKPPGAENKTKKNEEKTNKVDHYVIRQLMS